MAKNIRDIVGSRRLITKKTDRRTTFTGKCLLQINFHLKKSKKQRDLLDIFCLSFYISFYPSMTALVTKKSNLSIDIDITIYNGLRTSSLHLNIILSIFEQFVKKRHTIACGSLSHTGWTSHVNMQPETS